ncbi:MAG TPA: fimbria/pilus outer membrane usher protein [Gammaproteobacteria bacterium]|nr:fimbria/pilus outer membrane usher protein [Gammaproteobacteria bacterium]
MKRFLIQSLYLILLFVISQNVFASTSHSSFTPLFLAVVINGQQLEQSSLFLQNQHKQFWANKTDLTKWHFNLADKKFIQYEGNIFYALDDFIDLHYALDEQTGTLNITTTRAKNFSTNFINESKFVPIQVNRPSPGGFLNYDLSGQTLTSGAANSTSGGIFEGAVFNKYGVGTSEMLVDHSGNSSQVVRLETNWTNDQPEKMRSWRLGDSFTDSGIWGQSVGFGGVQLASNFGTQPSFVPFPLPSSSGAAVLPTTIDLYANNILVGKEAVQNGPFDVVNIPVVNGYGQLTVVSTDLLGRQQAVSLPYYMSTALLKPGLHQYSFEAGFIRNNLGVSSSDYGHFAAVGTDAVGLNDKFTGQWHAEAMTNQQTLGVGANYIWSLLGVVTVATAVSRSNSTGYGGLAEVGFQHQANNNWNYGLNVQLTSHDFQELAYQSGNLAPSVQTQAFIGMPLSKGRALGFSYTLQENRNQASVSVFNASYSQTVFKSWSVNVTALTNISGVENKAVYLTLSKALDTYTSLNIGSSGQPGSNFTQGYAQLNRALPYGPGYGYNLFAGTGNLNQYQAAVSAQNDVGTYTLGAANLNGQQGFTAEAKGGIVYMDRPYLIRDVTNSFAVVRVGYPNVRVYQFNQEVASTDARGNALIPNLIAYQDNPIRIEPRDLPFDAEIDQTQVDVVPYLRSGVIIPFAVKQANAAMMTVTDSQHQFIPAGASVTLSSSMDEFIVGEQGQLYLTGLAANNRVTIQWEGRQCDFEVSYMPTEEPLPNLGAYVCQEIP